MHIEKLEIGGFGKLKDVSICLSKGLNVIYGANESGKSTLQLFIKAMFYGLKGGRTSRDGTPPPLKKYRPWTGEEYRGAIHYKLDNGQAYRVERNFGSGSVKVFDSSFSDITGSFDLSRDRGPLFAERHLGMSEECFERTVFVEQLETRLDDSGRKELLNRLTNITQTGFDDISFRKAQEALKEALKINVGTEKTSVRPLDRINARLKELETLKAELENKRKRLISMEEDRVRTASLAEKLKNKRMILEKIRDLLEIRKKLVAGERILEKLKTLALEADSVNNALEEIRRAIDEAATCRMKFSGFASYDEDHIEQLTIEFDRLQNLIRTNEKLRLEIEEKKDLISGMEKELKNAGVFSALGADAENYVSALKKEIENLKEQLNGYDCERIRQSLKDAQKSLVPVYVGIAFSAVFVLIFLGYALAVRTGWGANSAYAASILSSGVFIFSLFRKARLSRKISQLTGMEKMFLESARSIEESISKRQQELDSILLKAGAESVEDFLGKRALYNKSVQTVNNLYSELYRLENSVSENNRSIEDINGKLALKLYECGVLSGTDGLVREEDVIAFKNGVRSFRMLTHQLETADERRKNLKTQLERIYMTSSEVAGFELNSVAALKAAVCQTEGDITKLKSKLDECVKDILEACEAYPDEEDFKGIPERYSNQDVERAEKLLREACARNEEDLKNAVLRLKELEVLLEGFQDDDSIQKAEEEIERLQLSKRRLEDIAFSLKTAMDVLTEASLEIQRQFAPALNQRMNYIASRITGGRYKDTRADNDLYIRTLSPETGEVVSVSMLSGGTVDQMYLAMRLSAAEIINMGGESLPIVLDEAFSQYDDDRARHTIEYLAELSFQRQVLLFTCKAREVEIIKEICGNGANYVFL